ncbi:MAG: aminotransferase class I/II-fold pyridoxal phosphate-dependent enzyme, partial [Shimia sp.]
MTPDRFSALPEAIWPRLRALLDPHTPGKPPINMTIGEPKHPFPPFILDALREAEDGWGTYPNNTGTPELLSAIAGWIARRYGVSVDPATQVMALNGTREGLFSAAVAICPDRKAGQRPAVLVPNPFYPVYGVAALAARAQPIYMPATEATGHLPDFSQVDAATLDRTAIAYVCSPANPQGTVASEAYWRELLTLAERHDFKVFADECYSEIYRDTPPPGALEMAAKHGADPERVVVFHSLSKRSNLPGLRSGFVAGGPRTMAEIKRMRALAGAPVPNPIQHASAAAWSDEGHVEENRRLYRDKFRQADHIFAGIPGYASPEAGFFLWLAVGTGEETALRL